MTHPKFKMITTVISHISTTWVLPGFLDVQLDPWIQISTPPGDADPYLDAAAVMGCTGAQVSAPHVHCAALELIQVPFFPTRSIGHLRDI